LNIFILSALIRALPIKSGKRPLIILCIINIAGCAVTGSDLASQNTLLYNLSLPDPLPLTEVVAGNDIVSALTAIGVAPPNGKREGGQAS